MGDLQKVKKALERILVGGNHLSTALGNSEKGDICQQYPYTMCSEEVLEKMGYCNEYEMWVCWSIMMQEREALEKLNEFMELQKSEKQFIYKQVERGLFDGETDSNAALKNIASHPQAPWSSTEWEWDVSHCDYSERFYEVFPQAAINVIKEKGDE